MVKKILLVAASVALIFAAFIFYQLNKQWKNIEINTENVILEERYQQQVERVRANRQDEPTEKTNDDQKTSESKSSDDFYALAVGLDTRGEQFTLNTDSIIVAHIIPETQNVKLTSIPRDTMILNSDLEGEGKKINAVFAEGYMHARSQGMKDPSLLSGKTVRLGGFHIAEEYISSGMVVLREDVEELLDIDIDYTFLINFETVVSLVDFVGGLEIDVDREMYWEDTADGTVINFEKGLQLLDGREALNFARFRRDLRGEEFYSNDFERGERQQKIMIALVEKLNSWNNITKALSILDIVSSNVKTDMPRGTMFNLARRLYGNINSDQVALMPFPGYWENPFVVTIPEEFEVFKKEFSSIEPLGNE